MKDAEKLVAWLREGADELEKAHLILDDAGVPRKLVGNDPNDPTECTLAARISMYSIQKGPFHDDICDYVPSVEDGTRPPLDNNQEWDETEEVSREVAEMAARMGRGGGIMSRRRTRKP